MRGGRIVAIGNVSGSAREEIDAAGRVVAPGFIDVHTHYDCQLFWDPAATPSPWHGVTTVVMGNCGFTIAPCREADRETLMRLLLFVEGMPLESLRSGVPWNWRSFGEYLGQLEGRLAVNAGFLVGHSAVRRVVMGERAVGHEATADELARGDGERHVVDGAHDFPQVGPHLRVHHGIGLKMNLHPPTQSGTGSPAPMSAMVQYPLQTISLPQQSSA